MQGSILVAEKSKTVRRMVEIALARHSFDLEFAEDGNAALKAIQSKSPTIAIVDAGLSGLDGYELTKRVKDAGSKTQVILLVGRNNRYDAGKGRSVGVDDHLTKPFLTQKIVEKVFGAINQPVPDADIFRTSLLSIPLANPSAAAAAEEAASAPSLAAPARKPAPSASLAAPSAPEAVMAPPAPVSSAVSAGAQSPFDDTELTHQYQPPPVDSIAEGAARSVLDSAALKEALGEDGPIRELFERVVWEVVPQLAEAILKEEIAKVVRERMSAAS